jgi:hypothetical protein
MGGGMITTHETRDDLILGKCDYEPELVTADLTGTAGSITSATNETVDQDTKTLVVSVDGGANQTVTFDGTTNTAALIAEQANAQLDGCSVEVSGGHVKITSDSTGLGSSIAIDVSSTATLTWDAAVAGTGQSATWPKGTLLARNTSTKKMGPYSDSGSNGLNEPTAVLPHSLTFAASGDLSVRVIKGGHLNKTKLSKLDDSTAIDTLVFDKLIKNSGITFEAVKDLGGTESW